MIKQPTNNSQDSQQSLASPSLSLLQQELNNMEINSSTHNSIMEESLDFDHENSQQIGCQPHFTLVQPENGTLLANLNENSVSNKLKKPIYRAPWTQEEDKILKDAVEKFGSKRWTNIATLLPGRNGKQCRERWHNHLNPDVKRGQWTDEEDAILRQAVEKYGNRWGEIGKMLPGRTDNSAKCRYYCTIRREQRQQKKEDLKNVKTESSEIEQINMWEKEEKSQKQ